MSFRAEHLGFAYGVRDATFALQESGLVAIAGPNGAGKSTLLGILAGLRHPYRGSCLYEGVEMRRWVRRDFARRVAFLPQMVRLEFPFTAEQVVMMGRTPYGGGWYESPEDFRAVESAMQTADVLPFRSRDFRSLSGGERQRVILASALAQEPRTLLLDEPTTFLDLKHQLSMYRLLRELGARGMLIVSVTHDLNLALEFADRVLVVDQGSIAGDGDPRTVLNQELIDRVFGVRVEVNDGWIRYGR
ncbi:MAG TPA: ABC transporter ATP-binding protein [Bryobacteraceae bacterium]|nr:ABC transporter ATP-binding protein [Bryobacteraceae bacterium]